MPDGDGGQGGATGATGPGGGQQQQGGTGASGASGASGATGGTGTTGGTGGAGGIDAELAALGVTAEEYAALGDPGKRAIDRLRTQLRDRGAKIDELTPLAEAARAAEDAKKSETERLNGKLTEAEQRATSAEGQAVRLKACLAAGMSGEQALDLADRLKGKTEAELLEDAKKLAATLAPGQQQRRTDPALGAGSGGGGQGGGSGGMSSLIRQAAGREA